ncbi:MAG: flavodoxin family protein [Ignavibacteriales bacterium]
MEAHLKSFGDIEFEYVFLKDYRLDYCKGCCACFLRGEEHCPLKDDRDVLLAKIADADGVILASPNYSFQVSAQMKNLLDRMSFILHRPRFFGKAFTSIVAQGIHGGAPIVKYLASVGEGWGCSVTKGCFLTALDSRTPRQEKRIAREIERTAKEFHEELVRPGPRIPSLFRLMLFRMARTAMKATLDDTYYDYRYYSDKGWFESDYYCDVPLGFFRKRAGSFFDFLGVQMAKYR